MKLKNGMFVICPEGEVSSYLTNGKKYEVFDVEGYANGSYYFNIIDDDGDKIGCVIIETCGCVHLKCKHWIIDNPEKP